MTTRTLAPAATRSAPTLARHVAGPGSREVLAFAAIGMVSTIAYVALYAALRALAQAAIANAAALVLTAIGNTAANRRLTFGVRGRDRLGRDHLAGLAAFAAALTITSAALALLAAVAPNPPRMVEIAALVAANGVATVVRFLVLRRAMARTPASPSLEGTLR